MIRAQS